MALSYNLGYQESISVHPTRRQNFAGKVYSNFPNIWKWVILIWEDHWQVQCFLGNHCKFQWFWRDHCKFSMVFEETITIECFLGGLTIAINGFTMVFDVATIASDAFRWFRTIGQTIRWFRWIVVVYVANWPAWQFNKFNHSSGRC